MKTIKQHLLTAFFLVALFPLFTTSAQAQLQVELTGGAGYTGIDFYAWSGQDRLSNWNQFSWEAALSVFAAKKGKLQFGVEGGYQYFGWYTVKRQSEYFPGYTTYNVSAIKALAVVRANLSSNLFAELGAGVYMFSDWTDVGVQGAVGYRLKLNEHWSIPVKAKGGVIIDTDAFLFPVGLSAGVAYTF